MAIFSKKHVFLFPPSKARLDSLSGICNGESRPERYLFYGLDLFIKSGIPIVHNIQTVSLTKLQTLITLGHRKICGKLFIFYGEIEWVFPVFKYLFQSPLLFVFSERIMLAICYWRLAHLLPKRPTVFMPIGLPEKLAVLRERRPRLFRLVRRSLQEIAAIVCVSELEAQELRDNYGLAKAVFVKAGVDSNYFAPVGCQEDVDVVSIGADKFRDFQLLIDSARELKEVSYCIITTARVAGSFKDLPNNIEVLTDVPMAEIRSHIARGRILALPVIPNSYSGATTVLLQAMAMGKAVIANQEGANASGYPFYHNTNLMYVNSCDLKGLTAATTALLGDDTLRKTMGTAARNTVLAHLRLEDFHKNLLAIFDAIHLQAWGSRMNGDHNNE